MIRSFYTAASGVLTESRNLNVLSNNISNTNTNGFKRDIPTNATFDQVMLARLSDGTGQWVGNSNFIRYNDSVVTDYGQGNMVFTGNPLDFALQGDGYFKIMDNNGEYL